MYIEHDTPQKPVTPTHDPNEISAFSPDTPSEATLDGGSSSRAAGGGLVTPAHHQTRFKAEPLASTLSLTLQSTPVSTDDTSPGKIIDSYCLPQVDNHVFDRECSMSSLSCPVKLHPPPPVGIQKNDREIAYRYDENSWILDSLAAYIDDYPNSMLQLNAPVIAHIRHQSHHRSRITGQYNYVNVSRSAEPFLCNDKACVSASTSAEGYHSHFRKVFPYTSDLLVSALFATLIAQKYLSMLAHIQDQSKPSLFEDLESIPTKARSTLGIHCCEITANQRKEAVLKRIAGKNTKILSQIVDKLLMKICGRVDEFMKRMLESIAELMMRE
jgi:hypothetical protein